MIHVDLWIHASSKHAAISAEDQPQQVEGYSKASCTLGNFSYMFVYYIVYSY